MKAMKKYRFEPDYAVLPGDTLLEVLESQDMTQKDLAIRTGLTVQTISRIISGEQPISYATANHLEMVTGVPAKFWNNLEANFREQVAKLKEQERLSENIAWLKNVPVNEIFSRGYAEKGNSKVEDLKNVLSFYGVSSVEAWHKLWEDEKIAARRSHSFETIPEAASAWIRMGELEAAKISTQKFDKSKLRYNLDKIHTMTVCKPEEFKPQMKQLCAEAGVALTFIPKLKKVPWNGASKWINPDKALIILNIRGKKEDTFWFSFFHEAAHILKDPKKGLYIADGSDDPVELRADEFAAHTLIDQKYNERIKKFKSHDEFSALAKELDISPGIIVGRYHHLTKKYRLFNSLIKSFEWVGE